MGDGAAVDQVEIALAEGRAPRVEAGGRHTRVQHPDRTGEERVEAAGELRRIEGGTGGKAGDLAKRVNAGVSPARARELDRLAEDARAGFPHESLHRRRVRLNLPAREVRAVVGEGQAQGAQGALSGSEARRPGPR